MHLHHILHIPEAIRRKPYSVVLFDEIEKAHPDVFNILLQVLDDGRLTDNKGRVVNFKNTIIVMTSNMGSSLIRENFEKMTPETHDRVVDETKNQALELLKTTIRPEFLNRIDDIIMFTPLNEEEIRQIHEACGGKVLKVIIETCLLTQQEKIKLCGVVTESGADFIKTSTGFSEAGATFEDIELFRKHVGEGVKIKAAGGITSLEDAERFVQLGADRLGTSRVVKLLKG